MKRFETLLYGVREGLQDWQEELLSSNPEVFDKVKELASRDGFGRFRITTVDLYCAPQFGKNLIA